MRQRLGRYDGAVEPNSLLPALDLPEVVVDDLRRMNPWWTGQARKPLPPMRRHLVQQIHRRLESRLAPIVAVRGPRQIGKTTAQLQVIEDLLAGGTPPETIVRFQADELRAYRALRRPILDVVAWYERAVLGRSLDASAAGGRPAHVFLDEVQNLPDWAAQLKSLVDHAAVRVVITGSSALRIERGRDSLAGRMSTIEAGVLSLTEIGALRSLGLGAPLLADNGLEPLGDPDFWRHVAAEGERRAPARDAAFAAFSERGGYPLGHEHPGVPWDAVAQQLNETVIRRVIQHDLRVGDRGRKRDPALLEEVFRMACRYVGQPRRAVELAREAREASGATVGVRRVEHYLRFLHETLLLRLIEPLEIRLKKRRSGAKLCLADHALRASWLQESVPLAPSELRGREHLSTLAGRLVDSIVGVTLASISNLALAYLPERPDQPEVDYVVSLGTRRVPIEVKYQRTIDPVRDLHGLHRFLDRPVNEARFGLLITQEGRTEPRDPRIIALPLSSFLLLR